jgi:hypothetical protein
MASVRRSSVPKFWVDALALVVAPRRSFGCCPPRRNLAGGENGRLAVAMASGQSSGMI